MVLQTKLSLRTGRSNIPILTALTSPLWMKNSSTLLYISARCTIRLWPPPIVDGGAQKYVGGDTDLMIGPSEKVFKCVLDEVINDDSTISSALNYCEDKYRSERPGTHGISGNGSDYLTVSTAAAGGNYLRTCH